MSGTKIYINDFRIAYMEGDMPIYLQLYAGEDGNITFGLCAAKDDETAIKLGRENGYVIESVRLVYMFSRLKMLLDVEKKLK